MLALKLRALLTTIFLLAFTAVFAQTTVEDILSNFELKWAATTTVVYFIVSFLVTKIPFLQKIGDAKWLTGIVAALFILASYFIRGVPLPSVMVGIAAATKIYDIIKGYTDSFVKKETIEVKSMPIVQKAIDQAVAQVKQEKRA